MYKIPSLQYYRYLLINLREELFVVFLSLASALIGLAVPYISKLVIDRAYAQKNFHLFFILSLIGGVIVIFNEILNYVTNYISQKISLRIRNSLSAEVFTKSIQLPYSYFQDNPSSQSVHHLQFDVELISQFVSETIPQLIFNFLRLIFIIAVIFYLDWRIAIAFLLISPLALLLPMYSNSKLKVSNEKWAEDSQRIFVRLHEVFCNIKLIKLFDTHDKHIKERISDLKNSFELCSDRLRLELNLFIASLTLNRFFLGALLLYCSYGLFNQKMSLGTLSAIALYLSQIFQIHNSLVCFLYSVPRFLVSSKRLEHITNMRLTIRSEPIKIDQGKIIQDLSFDRVAFQYKNRSLLFSDVSFEVKSGSTMGLVGLSGCGKSTIINLILGLFTPTAGGVFIGGINVGDFDRSFLHEYVAVVPQELFLWNASLADNIAYGLKNASIAKIKEAARLACIDEFIETLKKKYDTIVGEDACRLSEGQKQRVSVARAIIRNPRILLLDEATAHLDIKNENDIFNNLRKYLPETTIIFVAHGQGLLEKADKVCFLHNQYLIESASHKELLAENRDYARVNNSFT
jgi:ABC-type bacteriocin/lantibiotic exporter with double-glycine peptidase domain